MFHEIRVLDNQKGYSTNNKKSNTNVLGYCKNQSYPETDLLFDKEQDKLAGYKPGVMDGR